MNIVHLPAEIKKEFKLDSEGKAFVSIRGAARLCGVDHSALVRSFQGGDLKQSKLAEMLIQQGFEPGVLSETGIPDLALVVILKYYAFKAQRTTEQAERFFDAMSAIGVRTWIQSQLGWNSNPQPEQKRCYYYERYVEFITNNKVPAGYFSIFEETLRLVGQLESKNYVLPKSALPDGSVGKCWANYLKGKGIKLDSVAVKYSHKFPNDPRGVVQAWAYPNEMLPNFREWFDNTYKCEKLGNYLKSRQPDALPALAQLLDLPQSLMKQLVG